MNVKDGILTYFRLAVSMAIVIILCGMISSCHSGSKEMTDAKRSVYYWRTTFRLSAEEQTFIKSHRIERMYLHVFDVVKKADGPKPDATLLIEEETPSGMDVVPVVFVTSDVITAGDSTAAKALGRKITERVKQMMDTHKLSWHEMQIDFDWTKRNQDAYFSMLREMRENLKGQQRGLSTTIRLHQLALEAPPVDYGALMVYNIGNYADASEPNSILSTKNLQQYIRYLADYPLPLATALPFYSWNLTFKGDKFMGIAHNLDITDTTMYHHVEDSKEQGEIYIVKKYHTEDNNPITLMQPGIPLYPGYRIRHEECSAELLTDIREMIYKERSNALDEIIIYHLDNKNLKKYSYEEIETIFSDR